MALSRPGEKRRAKRFEIECPVTVAILSPRNGRELKEGRLRDIGVRGARFYLDYPLVVGAHVLLHVHFPHSSDRVSVVRYEGIVKRVHRRPPYEVAMQFRRGGRFLRGKLRELFRNNISRSESGE